MKTGPTPEARSKASAARAAIAASTPTTTRPGSETTTLQVGDRVVVTRGRNTGRTGTVVSINTQRFGPPHSTTYVEIGLVHTWRPNEAKQLDRASAEKWYRDDELA